MISCWRLEVGGWRLPLYYFDDSSTYRRPNLQPPTCNLQLTHLPPGFSFKRRTLCKTGRMERKHIDYYNKHENRSFSDQKQLITFSFNDDERTIVGAMEEKDNLIYLYEYRGKLVGTEFFISFSKQSISYKLIKVGEMSV